MGAPNTLIPVLEAPKGLKSCTMRRPGDVGDVPVRGGEAGAGADIATGSVLASVLGRRPGRGGRRPPGVYLNPAL
jgi:hypothetical protein